jgi:hypothetical protein
MVRPLHWILSLGFLLWLVPVALPLQAQDPLA